MNTNFKKNTKLSINSKDYINLLVIYATKHLPYMLRLVDMPSCIIFVNISTGVFIRLICISFIELILGVPKAPSFLN